MTRFRPRILTAVALTAVATLTATLGVTASNASRTDAEWTHGLAGTLDCDAAETGISTAADGTALRGELLGIQLDDVADVYGVNVTNDGDDSTVLPTSANEVPTEPDAYSNPLDVGVLNSAIHLNLTNLLTLPLNNDLGVLGQYGQATTDGTAVAASGYVTDNGAISLEPDNGYPELATLKLSDLLNALGFNLGTLVGPVSDIDLNIGAIAGRAEIDGCDALWEATDAAPAALARDYLAADLDTVVTSEVVEGVAGDLIAVADSVVSTVEAIAADEGLVDGLLGGLSNILGTALTGLRLGDIGVEVTASVDRERVADLLGKPVSDPDGVLEINLGAGTVTISTAALLDAAYPDHEGSGLNSLAPNTNPLADPHVLTTLEGRLISAIEPWVSSIVDQVLDLVTLDVKVILKVELLSLLSIVDLEVHVAGPLDDLQLTVAKPKDAILLLILKPLTDLLLRDLPGLVLELTEPALKGALTSTLATAKVILAEVTNLVTTVYTKLFLDGIVSITLNAQNRPATGNPGPADWNAKPRGEYSVAALRVGVLDALGDLGVRLYLGQATVGPTCGPASTRCTAP